MAQWLCDLTNSCTADSSYLCYLWRCLGNCRTLLGASAMVVAVRAWREFLRNFEEYLPIERERVIITKTGGLWMSLRSDDDAALCQAGSYVISNLRSSLIWTRASTTPQPNSGCREPQFLVMGICNLATKPVT